MRKTLNNNERRRRTKLWNLNSRCGLFIELLIVRNAFSFRAREWIIQVISVESLVIKFSLRSSKQTRLFVGVGRASTVPGCCCIGHIRTCITASILNRCSLAFKWALCELPMCFHVLFSLALFIQSQTLLSQFLCFRASESFSGPMTTGDSSAKRIFLSSITNLFRWKLLHANFSGCN